MNQQPKVWILDDEGLPHDKEIEIYNEHQIEYKITTKDSYEEDLETFGRHADAIVAQVGFRCSAELIEQLERCKIICTFGMGFNHVDLDAAKAHNIYVCNVPNYCATEVADHTLALSLTLLRKLNTYNRNVKNRKWDPTNAGTIQRMSHIVVGLLGFGQIAQMVATRFQAFGVKLMAHDPFVDEETFERYNVLSVTLDELLNNSNLLSLHIPLTKDTKHIINEQNMRKLPKNAMIVNTCRGGIINEKALAQLIKEKHISGAGLDVLETEPPVATNPLLDLEEVIITPHAAYYSVQAEEQMQTETAMNILRVLNNETPKNIVN